MTPQKRPASVKILLTDGRVQEKTVTSSKGDPDQPMTQEELKAKFIQLVLPLITTHGQARQAWQRLGQLDAESSIDNLLSLLAAEKV